MKINRFLIDLIDDFEKIKIKIKLKLKNQILSSIKLKLN